ncbi:MAG TPA: helix-turn-helix domain-containing protein [Solirubrobacterales bacterium]|nr:helix-turn-helix domain-containing protein [Solirubrobacterales bacterium]
MATLSTKDSIVRSALRLFGEAGIEPTSLREVAKAAGVSPALVVHHFGGRQGLVAAADEAAVREFGAAYAGEEPEPGADLLRLRAEQTAQVMRERPEVCAYLGRAMVERTDGAARLLRLMIEGGEAEIDSLAEEGALRPDADRRWATLQHFFLIWAPLSFLPLLEEALGSPLLEEEQLDRWVEANVELLKGGLYR